MKTKRLSLLLLVALLFVSACSSKDKKDDVVQAEQGLNQAVTLQVALYSYSFSPATLSINVGDSVVFENKDPDVRNVSIPALNVDQNIQADSSWRFTFNTAGEYLLNDRLTDSNPTMTITVK